MGTVGSDLLQQMMDGGVKRVTPGAVKRVKDDVVPALVELLSVGARIRPLMLDGRQVGFVRSVLTHERRHLFSWFKNPEDRMFHLIQSATTLSPDTINSLDGFESRLIVRMINKMTEADLSLYPYIHAFSTTSASEMLWYGSGTSLSAWSDKTIKLPGGSTLTLYASSEHARLWATVSSIRERSKKGLDDTFNSAMVTKALVGKAADKLYSSLRKQQQGLESDNDDLWLGVVRAQREDTDFNDGWGHAMEDDSIEGILREVDGMNSMDKHEAFMEDYFRRQTEEAEARAAAVRARAARSLAEEVDTDVLSVMTSADLQEFDDRNAEQRRLIDSAVSRDMGLRR